MILIDDSYLFIIHFVFQHYLLKHYVMKILCILMYREILFLTVA